MISKFHSPQVYEYILHLPLLATQLTHCILYCQIFLFLLKCEHNGNPDDFYPNITYYGGLVVKDSTPAITVQENTGTNTDASETRPFSYGVVWIIKL